MAKIPDLSELGKKLDNLVESVKSAIGGGGPAKPPEGDEIAAKFVELIGQLQVVMDVHAEQTRSIALLQQKLNDLYKDVQAYRAGPTTPSSQ
jgi:hypothetical protein